MVTDLTWETIAKNVISQLTNALAELNAIAKIHKNRRLHEGHHFIPMAMKMQSTLGHDMNHFIKELFVLFMIDNQKVIYPCLFTFNFSNMLILPFNVI
jgi:hypothetical protein